MIASNQLTSRYPYRLVTPFGTASSVRFRDRNRIGSRIRVRNGDRIRNRTRGRNGNRVRIRNRLGNGNGSGGGCGQRTQKRMR